MEDETGSCLEYPPLLSPSQPRVACCACALTLLGEIERSIPPHGRDLLQSASRLVGVYMMEVADKEVAMMMALFWVSLRLWNHRSEGRERPYSLCCG